MPLQIKGLHLGGPKDQFIDRELETNEQLNIGCSIPTILKIQTLLEDFRKLLKICCTDDEVQNLKNNVLQLLKRFSVHQSAFFEFSEKIGDVILAEAKTEAAYLANMSGFLKHEIDRIRTIPEKYRQAAISFLQCCFKKIKAIKNIDEINIIAADNKSRAREKFFDNDEYTFKTIERIIRFFVMNHTHSILYTEGTRHPLDLIENNKEIFEMLGRIKRAMEKEENRGNEENIARSAIKTIQRNLPKKSLNLKEILKQQIWEICSVVQENKHSVYFN